MSNKDATIQLRIDSKTKRAARRTLDELGIDMSSAVKLFLRNVVITQSIPLHLRTENGFTLAEEQALLRDTVEAKRTGKRHVTTDELFADWQQR